MSNESKNSRRTFIRTAAAGAMAAVTPSSVKKTSEMPTILPKNPQGANDRIRVAVLGVNGRGKSHIKKIFTPPNSDSGIFL